jgi:polyisoprenyl-phosphate glycosyltransferase
MPIWSVRLADPAPLDVFVTAVVPLADDADIVEEFLRELHGVLRRSYVHYEIVLVDDASTDATVERVDSLMRTMDELRLMRLSRHFGQEIAISAGLESAIGDYVVVILPASDPPALVPEMVARSRGGAGVVFGIRSDRSADRWWHRAGVSLFYRFGKRLIGLDLPPGVTHFRVLSRQAVNAITQIKDRSRYLRTLSAYVGYPNQGFFYAQVERRSPPRRKGFLECTNLAISIVVANSTHALRLVSLLGLAMALVNLGYVLYVAAVWIVKRQVAEGWTTQALLSALMFCSMFVILTVLCEYLGRLLEETRQRPLYYVLDERSSNVLGAGAARRNVVTESSTAHGPAR